MSNSDPDKNKKLGACQWPDCVITVEMPAGGKIRARRVISRSRARPTGMFPSWKVGRMVHWESPHERNAFVLLDGDSEVRTFREQPVTIEYSLDSRLHVHYPDVLVEYHDGRRELWEVKPAAEAEVSEISRRTLLMQCELPRFGYRYRMVVAEFLSAEPRLTNSHTLLKYGRRAISGVARERIRRIFKVEREIPWALTRTDDFGPEGRAALCRLTLEGILSFDIDQKLTDGTRFALSPSRVEV